MRRQCCLVGFDLMQACMSHQTQQTPNIYQTNIKQISLKSETAKLSRWFRPDASLLVSSSSTNTKQISTKYRQIVRRQYCLVGGYLVQPWDWKEELSSNGFNRCCHTGRAVQPVDLRAKYLYQCDKVPRSKKSSKMTIRSAQNMWKGLKNSHDAKREGQPKKCTDRPAVHVVQSLWAWRQSLWQRCSPPWVKRVISLKFVKSPSSDPSSHLITSEPILLLPHLNGSWSSKLFYS